MQILDKRQAMSTWPLLRLGFRPFFLLGSTLAALAVPLWVFALLGYGITAQPLGGWLAWHRHELVFGFAGAIIAGFLLTAVQTWTGAPRPVWQALGRAGGDLVGGSAGMVDGVATVADDGQPYVLCLCGLGHGVSVVGGTANP